jgi:ribonuclease HII
MKKFYFNNEILDKNKEILEVGLDEAGRGPLIGRVYAAVVNWGDTEINLNVKDSKKLSSKKRAEVLKWIQENVDEWSVAWAEPEEIDSINILEATKLAMDRAIDQLTLKPTHLLIDGVGWENKFKNYKVQSIVKGDNKFYSIAAASIIAKEYHDQYIKDLCNENQELNKKYDLLNNMGYGTKKHLEGIQKYGYSNFHRKSFKIKKINL